MTRIMAKEKLKILGHRNCIQRGSSSLGDKAILANWQATQNEQMLIVTPIRIAFKLHIFAILIMLG